MSEGVACHPVNMEFALPSGTRKELYKRKANPGLQLVVEPGSAARFSLVAIIMCLKRLVMPGRCDLKLSNNL